MNTTWPETTLLLGAGASAEAGVPTTRPMTQKLVSAIDEARHPESPLAEALHFVCGALLAYDSADGINPFEGLDVERVFAAVELLAERQSLEVSPFVSAWHPAVDSHDSKQQSAPGMFDNQLKDAVLNSESFDSAGKLITGLVTSLTKVTPTGEAYKELARAMLSELRNLIWTTPKDASYLVPLVADLVEGTPVAIATLNYDLTIEQAAEQASVSCTTGIEQWLQDGDWHWPDSGVRLLKLHGSINWVWERQEHQDGQLPIDAIRITDEPANDWDRPAVVFGQRGKLRAEGPFLPLLAEFERHLSQSKHLLVVGYSFRDPHVNEVIRRWTSEDLGRELTIVDPNWPNQFGGDTEDFRRQLAHYLLPPSWDETKFKARLDIWDAPCSPAVARISG